MSTAPGNSLAERPTTAIGALKIVRGGSEQSMRLIRRPAVLQQTGPPLALLCSRQI
jgi:hypothetical protein